jgi:hypothetical protein
MKKFLLDKIGALLTTTTIGKAISIFVLKVVSAAFQIYAAIVTCATKIKSIVTAAIKSPSK